MLIYEYFLVRRLFLCVIEFYGNGVPLKKLLIVTFYRHVLVYYWRELKLRWKPIKNDNEMSSSHYFLQFGQCIKRHKPQVEMGTSAGIHVVLLVQVLVLHFSLFHSAPSTGLNILMVKYYSHGFKEVTKTYVKKNDQMTRTWNQN